MCAKEHQPHSQCYGITLKFLTTSGRLLDDVCTLAGTLTPGLRPGLPVSLHLATDRTSPHETSVLHKAIVNLTSTAIKKSYWKLLLRIVTPKCLSVIVRIGQNIHRQPHAVLIQFLWESFARTKEDPRWLADLSTTALHLPGHAVPYTRRRPA